MNGRFMLDTNAVIAFFSGEESVKDILRSAKLIYVPVPVIGELYYGVYCSKKVESNKRRIDELLRSVEILDCDLETSKFYAEIKKNLRVKGTKIPENDVWIAALSMQYNLTLITRDKHLFNVKEINLQQW